MRELETKSQSSWIYDNYSFPLFLINFMFRNNCCMNTHIHNSIVLIFCYSMSIFSLVIVFAASKYSRLFNLVLIKNVFLIGNYKNNTGLHVIYYV